MKKTVLIVIAVLIVGIAAYLIFGRNTTTNIPATNTTTTNTASKPQPASTPKRTATTPVVKYSDAGFSPSTVTIKSGGKVTFENDSSSEIQVDSNPHPVHTDNPQLNIGVIAPGQSMTVTLTTVGSWGYHDHLNPTNGGQIIVQ